MAQSDIIFSIVPPRDAVATARRVLDACRHRDAGSKRAEAKGTPEPPALLFIDMNAVSPKTVRTIASFVSEISTPASAGAPSDGKPHMRKRTSSFAAFLSGGNGETKEKPNPIPVNFLDGAIMGAPPREAKPEQADSSSKDKGKPNPEASSATSISKRAANSTWFKPRIVLSGPLDFCPTNALMDVLNARHIHASIGPASALKGCFAAMNKGFTGISLLSYTTASIFGILPDLRAELATFRPEMKAYAEAALTSMPPKAYRWVEEMREIAQTFDAAGFGGSSDGKHGHVMGNGGSEVFKAMADVWGLVADDTELGKEKTEKRKRGTTVEDVTKAMEDGMQGKRKKREKKGEDLSLTWRGSWS